MAPAGYESPARAFSSIASRRAAKIDQPDPSGGSVKRGEGDATFRLSLGPTGAATAFSWVVLDAGGYLAGLRGRGTGYSPDVTDVGGTDCFVGEMHLE